jgi:hypothetical protein
MASGDSETLWAGNPNSGNQRWSKWRFTLRLPPLSRVTEPQMCDNARRFFAKLFRSQAGSVKVGHIGRRWWIELRMEGVAVHDPGVRAEARRLFARDFVRKGLGGDLLDMEAGLLAGTREDGTPRDHLIVMPTLALMEH